jgi:SAM-dependent methyltransferase
MPGEATLSRMYGPAYQSEASRGGEGIGDPKDQDSVVALLAKLRPGTFIDYGCGDGSLLTRVAPMGWEVIGVEFDRDVAARTAVRTGMRVCARSSAESLADGAADVLHLGDVIEHLISPAAELRRILRLVKRGGYLVAQGPLEANANLFTTALKTWRRLSVRTVSEMAPYHVMLATRAGQEALFARAGLVSNRFTLSEVEWPAPSRLTRTYARNPRHVALFILRRASRATTSLRPSKWGNRYFYVGRLP